MSKKLSHTFSWMIKVFFIGLLIQFFVQTFVTYQLGWTGAFWSGVWLWKEFFILIFLWAVAWRIINLVQTYFKKQKSWSYLSAFIRFLIYFALTVVVFCLLAIVVQKLGIGTFLLSAKYDLFWFLIFIIGVGLASYLSSSKKFTQRYQKLLKWVIVGGFFWWILVYLMPNALKFFGYSHFAYEGTLESRPPAVYYTQISQGHVRNQFLFERPISFWFFLIAFWPFFALGYLRKRSIKEQIAWTFGFGAMVFSTLSRAAIGVWLLQTAILTLIIHRKRWKNVVLFLGIPGTIVLLFGLWHFRGIFAREHSNTGHIALLQEGWKIGMQEPLTGWGAGYSGPASHQLCNRENPDPRCEIIVETNNRYSIPTVGYNPENQYVQIFMEYGIIGLISWMFCFGWLIWNGLRAAIPLAREWGKGKKADKAYKQQLYLLLAFGIGMIGLALEGMVLHSFVDRMIVYPFMLLFGLHYGEVLKRELPALPVSKNEKI